VESDLQVHQHLCGLALCDKKELGKLQLHFDSIHQNNSSSCCKLKRLFFLDVLVKRKPEQLGWGTANAPAGITCQDIT
jgi:hypothetical protein